jgi:hypothetical protein
MSDLLPSEKSELRKGVLLYYEALEELVTLLGQRPPANGKPLGECTPVIRSCIARVKELLLIELQQ